MNTETTTNKVELWSARILSGLSVAIAAGLALAGPVLMVGALVLAVLAGDATIVGLGMLAGAVLGVAGALALLWCLAGLRKQVARSAA